MWSTSPRCQNGNSLGNASFTAAWVDGYDRNRCSGTYAGNNRVDLSSEYRPSWERGENMCDDDDSFYDAPEYAGTPEPAYFY